MHPCVKLIQVPFCRRQAHLCALAANCDEPMYVKLVEALCAEHQINLIKVKSQPLNICQAVLCFQIVFIKVMGCLSCTAGSVMIIWLPLLNTMRKLPLLPNFFV